MKKKTLDLTEEYKEEAIYLQKKQETIDDLLLL